MVEYGVLTSMSIGNFLHRLTYDYTAWIPVVLIVAVVVIVIYDICKL